MNQLPFKSTPKALAHLTEVVRAAYILLTQLYVPVVIYQYSGELFKSSVEPYLTWKLTKSLTSVIQERSVCEACECLLLPEEMHVFVDMLQAKAWIIYMNTHFSSFVMYIWTWARKKISIFWPGNLNKSSWSSDMAERQVRRSYREALVQISPTIEQKRAKGNRGALERVVGEWEGKKEEERDGKR